MSQGEIALQILHRINCGFTQLSWLENKKNKRVDSVNFIS